MNSEGQICIKHQSLKKMSLLTPTPIKVYAREHGLNFKLMSKRSDYLYGFPLCNSHIKARQVRMQLWLSISLKIQSLKNTN